MSGSTGRKRILSGNRPTGLLHLGNYFGALQNWVKMQDEYECFFMIADWHALTSDYADSSELRNYVDQMILDWLSIGLDPGRSTIFIQSQIKQHAELTLLLGMFTPLPWLERCPTYKEQITQMSNVQILSSASPPLVTRCGRRAATGKDSPGPSRASSFGSRRNSLSRPSMT